jgi:hypothetical protein
VPKQSSARRAPYAVGYGRPPVQTRFKPGQSGNPRGRPRKSPPEDPALSQIDPLLAATLRVTSEGVAVNVGGRANTVGGEEAIIRTLMDDALSGDIRATRILLELRTKAQEEEAFVKAQSRDTEVFARALSVVMHVLLSAKRQEGGGVDNLATAIERAALAALSGELSPDLSDGTTLASGGPDATNAAVSDAQHAPTAPSRGDFEDLRLYEDAPQRIRENMAPAPEPVAPDAPTEPIPPAAFGWKGGPLIASNQPLSGSGYGLGGKARPAPRCGTFK